MLSHSVSVPKSEFSPRMDTATSSVGPSVNSRTHSVRHQTETCKWWVWLAVAAWRLFVCVREADGWGDPEAPDSHALGARQSDPGQRSLGGSHALLLHASRPPSFGQSTNAAGRRDFPSRAFQLK